MLSIGLFVVYYVYIYNIGQYKYAFADNSGRETDITELLRYPIILCITRTIIKMKYNYKLQPNHHRVYLTYVYIYIMLQYFVYIFFFIIFYSMSCVCSGEIVFGAMTGHHYHTPETDEIMLLLLYFLLIAYVCTTS